MTRMDSVRIIQNRETRINGSTHYSNAYSFNPKSDPLYVAQLEQDRDYALRELISLYRNINLLDKYQGNELEQAISSIGRIATEIISKGSFEENIFKLLMVDFQNQLHPFRMRIHDFEMSHEKSYFPNKKQKN